MASSSPVATNLPREVLRWIQSLDLAYSVKNVKRDFANGFLTAEIFSRYYAKEIQMHSYDNGIGAKTKKDNWAQLMKIFRKVGLNDLVTENEVHLISCAEEGAAVAFISKLYEVLTQRVVQTQVKKPSTDREPGYSKEISVNKVRKALMRSDLRDDSDMNTISRVAFGAVDGHERSLQEERLQDPERFSTFLNTGPRVSQVMQRQSVLEADASIPQVKVKEINVKQLDRNVTHLRAMKQMQQGASGSPPRGRPSLDITEGARAVSPSGNEYGGRADSPVSQQSQFDNGGVGGGRPARGTNPDNSLSLLNTCLARIMMPECHPAWSAQLDPYGNFLAALDCLKVGPHIDDLVCECLVEVGNSAQMLAEACVVTPKQFWKVSDLFCSVIILTPFDCLSFASAIDGFEAIGRWVSVRDPVTSLALFCDFTLFKLTDTILRNSQKRQGIMRLLHAFAPQDTQSHVQCIKRLQSTVPDLVTFIHCLTILAVNESELDELLLDLYMYYATIAMGMPSPRLRAGAVAMLAAFVGRADNLIVPLLPQLRALAMSESWWEIHAHILSVCGSLLQSQNPSNAGSNQVSDSDEVVATVADIVNIVLSRNKTSKVITRWAVHTLATGTYLGDDFNATYLSRVEQLEEADRVFLLTVAPSGASRGGRRRVGPEGTITLTSTTGVPLALASVTSKWHPMVLVESLASGMVGKDRLSSSQMRVLNSCFQSAVENAKRTGEQLDDVFQGSWLASYEALKNFIFVAFCDPASSSQAAGICTSILFFSSLREKLLQETRLIGALRLLYPLNSSAELAACQAVMESFLREVFSAGHPFNAGVHSLLTQFAQNFSSQFDKYPSVQQLLKEFSRQMRN